MYFQFLLDFSSYFNLLNNFLSLYRLKPIHTIFRTILRSQPTKIFHIKMNITTHQSHRTLIIQTAMFRRKQQHSPKNHTTLWIEQFQPHQSDQINRHTITKRKSMNRKTMCMEKYRQRLIQQLHCMIAMKQQTVSHIKMVICHQVPSKRICTKRKRPIQRTLFTSHQMNISHQNQQQTNITSIRHQQRRIRIVNHY